MIILALTNLIQDQSNKKTTNLLFLKKVHNVIIT